MTALSSDLSPAQASKGLIFVQAVAYDVTYSVKIDGTEVASFTTPGAADDDNTISTTLVAEDLAADINGVAGYTAVTEKYMVQVTKDDGTDFRMEIDGRSNTLAKAFTNTVPDPELVANCCSNGYVVKVEADPSSTLDDRYLKFSTFEGATFGSGSWSETAEARDQYRFDENTMPLVIYRQSDGFLFVGPAD